MYARDFSVTALKKKSETAMEFDATPGYLFTVVAARGLCVAPGQTRGAARDPVDRVAAHYAEPNARD
jgi:hypothetical protein